MVEPIAQTPARDILAFAGFLRRRAVWIVVPVLFAAVAGTTAAFVSRPVYRAVAKVVPADNDRLDSAMSDVVGRFGGLVGLAGISSVGSANSSAISVELLRSKSLARTFIEQHELANKLLDCKEQASDAPRGVNCDSSIDEAVRLFDRRIRRVSQDRQSGIVSVAIDWYEPNEAAQWANGLVKLFNLQARNRARADAERNVGYLKRQLAGTSSVDVKDALYRLMEAELKSAMLAEVREEFALKVVDPAATPGPRDVERPRKWLWFIGSVAAGLILGLVLAVVVDLRALAKAAR